MTYSPRLNFRQRGSSLVFSLVLLGLVMLIGIGAMVSSNTQFKLAGNIQYQNLALNNAEASVAFAEDWLNELNASGASNYLDASFDTRSSTNLSLFPKGYMTSNSLDPLTMTWSDSNSKAIDASGNQRYLIEMIGKNLNLSNIDCGAARVSPTLPVNLYRVTGRGLSNRGAVKIVQSVFAVPNASGTGC